jgi:peptidyl-tRNA hydrolase, PTH1 family
MILIVGLGNIGSEYDNTRHNTGFRAIDNIQTILRHQEGLTVSDWEERKIFHSQISKVRKGGEIVAILQKPTTYMNLSGKAVRGIYDKFNAKNVILIHDDLDIKLGEYKIQEAKSPLGHNGVLSVEQALGTTKFKRVRIGIDGREGKDIPGEEYVLSRFKKGEDILVDECIVKATEELLATPELIF